MSAGTPVPPNPAYQIVPPPPQANSGNTVLKIVLIVVGVIVLLCVTAAGVIGIGVYRVAKTMHKDSNGNVSISTPNGTITTSKNANVSAAELGTVPYPGATNSEGVMNMKSPTGSMVTSVYTSSDSSDKIVAFYKDKLGDQTSTVQTINGTMLSSGSNDKDKVMVTITPQGSGSKIVILHVIQTKP